MRCFGRAKKESAWVDAAKNIDRAAHEPPDLRPSLFTVDWASEHMYNGMDVPVWDAEVQGKHVSSMDVVDVHSWLMSMRLPGLARLFLHARIDGRVLRALIDKSLRNCKPFKISIEAKSAGGVAISYAGTASEMTPGTNSRRDPLNQTTQNSSYNPSLSHSPLSTRSQGSKAHGSQRISASFDPHILRMANAASRHSPSLNTSKTGGPYRSGSSSPFHVNHSYDSATTRAGTSPAMEPSKSDPGTLVSRLMQSPAARQQYEHRSRVTPSSEEQDATRFSQPSKEPFVSHMMNLKDSSENMMVTEIIDVNQAEATSLETPQKLNASLAVDQTTDSELSPTWEDDARAISRLERAMEQARQESKSRIVESSSSVAAFGAIGTSKNHVPVATSDEGSGPRTQFEVSSVALEPQVARTTLMQIHSDLTSVPSDLAAVQAEADHMQTEINNMPFTPKHPGVPKMIPSRRSCEQLSNSRASQGGEVMSLQLADTAIRNSSASKDSQLDRVHGATVTPASEDDILTSRHHMRPFVRIIKESLANGQSGSLPSSWLVPHMEYLAKQLDNGPSCLISDAEGTYFGELSNGRRNGVGQLDLVVGDTFVGHWTEGHLNGFGACLSKVGDIYIGGFVEGKSTNFGRLIWSNGDVYEGEWREGQRHGRGLWKSCDGEVYDGEWRGDGRHGEGNFTWGNGDNYRGSWERDGMQGVGVMHYEDGSSYKGHWSKSKPHGDGVFQWAGGDKYTGPWLNGQMIGKGKIEYGNGDIYIGEVGPNGRHGFGKLVCSGGGVYEGTWQNDMREGWGRSQDQSETFWGQWQSDRQNGQGTLMTASGERFDGTFLDGQPAPGTVANTSNQAAADGAAETEQLIIL